MADWKIEPTIFMTVEEVIEATKCGYLNYDKEGALGKTDGAFGYKTDKHSFPTMFWGGGENERPDHQPMMEGIKNCWRFERDILYQKAVLWKDIRDVEMNRLKPCPVCGNHNVEIVSEQYIANMFSPNEDVPDEEGGFYIQCSAASQEDGCGMTSGWGPTEEKLRETWNNWKRCE